MLYEKLSRAICFQIIAGRVIYREGSGRVSTHTCGTYDPRVNTKRTYEYCVAAAAVGRNITPIFHKNQMAF